MRRTIVALLLLLFMIGSSLIRVNEEPGETVSGDTGIEETAPHMKREHCRKEKHPVMNSKRSDAEFTGEWTDGFFNTNGI